MRKSAILLHVSGISEGNDVIAAFKKLNDHDQQTAVSFLLIRSTDDTGSTTTAKHAPGGSDHSIPGS